MANDHWLQKRPEKTLDWIGIVFSSITFYVLLEHLDIFLNGADKLLGILSPFAGGIVIAYILDNVVRWVHHVLLKDNKKLRWIAILAAYAFAVLLIVLLGALVVPQVAESIVLLFNNLPAYIKNLQGSLLYIQETYGPDLSKAIDMLDDYGALMAEIYKWAEGWIPQAMGYLGNVASNFVSVFTAIASSIYMLADKEKLLRQLRTLAHAFLPPRAAENTLRICHIANENFSGFFVGKIIDSAIIWVITFVSMQILGLSFAPLISVVVGITNIIPVFGPFIGAIPSIVILLFVDPLQAFEFLLLILVIQQVDGNFIGPKILGQSIGISALWVLFSIVLGGDLLGVVGMVLGVPVFATCYSLLREVVHVLLKNRGIDAEGNPAPAQPEEEPAADPPAPQG